MKHLKTIAKVVAVVVVILILGLLITAFLPVSAYEPPARDVRDESQYRLNEKVGWYRLEDGTQRLLTWGAENGLVMYGFGSGRDALERIRFSPISARALVAVDSSRAENLEFLESGRGTAAEVRLIDAQGATQTLVRASDARYETREVTFNNGFVQLAGLLFVPSGPGPHPAVAFIHGSGVSHRDNFWYLSPADYLAKQGIMVLLPDKRGCGKSGGEWHTASFEDFAGDVLSAVALLRELLEVDQTRVGIVGFSQGGWIVPLVASRSVLISFVVTVSGSAATPSEQIAYEIRNEMTNDGAPGFIADLLSPLFARRAKMPRELWWEKNGDFDPMEYWRALEIPSLMIFGEEDQNVDVARSLLRLKEAGMLDRKRFRTKVFPGLSHALISRETGWVEREYLTSLARFVHQEE